MFSRAKQFHSVGPQIDPCSCLLFYFDNIHNFSFFSHFHRGEGGGGGRKPPYPLPNLPLHNFLIISSEWQSPVHVDQASNRGDQLWEREHLGFWPAPGRHPACCKYNCVYLRALDRCLCNLCQKPLSIEMLILKGDSNSSVMMFPLLYCCWTVPSVSVPWSNLEYIPLPSWVGGTTGCEDLLLPTPYLPLDSCPFLHHAC